MRILIDLSHPGHVHLYRNFIKQMEKKGHVIKVVARDKECALSLLDFHKIPYIRRKGYQGLMGKSIGMIKIDLTLLGIAKDFKPDILMGGVGNCYITQTSFLIGKPSIIFDDTEHAWLQLAMAKPFATKICTPSCYTKDLGKKQVRYDGFHELAYLHPAVFRPDHSILSEAGLKAHEPFFIVRLVSWDAHHDVSQKGFSIETKRKIISILEQHGRVLISSEAEIDPSLKRYLITVEPAKLHDLMAYASLFIGEGATMASEAAVLGVPSLYVNSLKLGYLTELEQRYGLVIDCTDPEKAMHTIKQIISDPHAKTQWKKKQDALLKDKVDVTRWMVDYTESFMEGKDAAR